MGVWESEWCRIKAGLGGGGGGCIVGLRGYGVV